MSGWNRTDADMAIFTFHITLEFDLGITFVTHVAFEVFDRNVRAILLNSYSGVKLLVGTLVEG